MTNQNPHDDDGPTPVEPAVDAAAEPTPGIDADVGSVPPAASRKRWIAAAAAALGVALFAVPLLRGPDGDTATDEAGSVASTTATSGPACAAKGTANLNFTLKDANGADVKLTDYKGKVVLLNFWATWCGPCKLEIPEFVEAYARYRDKGFVILGVLSEDDPSPEDLKTFITDFKMNYPVFREHQPLAEANGELWALPTSFVIDRKGAICSKHMGAMSKELLDREIKGLL
jgi:cytochrome c biogenesis protein CcmG/thiol:disulfide interchange protein DsbE